MIPGAKSYETAVDRSHRTHRADEYLIWRSPAFNAQMRFVKYSGIIIFGVLVCVLVFKSVLAAQIWAFASMLLGIWKILTPLRKTDLGYTITSKRLIVFRLHRTIFGDPQTSYDLSDYHRPVIERHAFLRNHGDLRFDRATADPESWRNSIIVRAISFLFESIRVRDVRNPEVVAKLITEDKSVKWGAEA